jgi:hypothetical protein
MKKIAKILSSAALTTGMFLANPLIVLAADQIPDGGGGSQKINLSATGQFTQLNGITVTTLVSGLVRLVLVIAALVFFFILVIGGIQWIISGGDKTGVETARKRITNALIGLAIVFVAWAIISLINQLFNVSIFSLNLPTLY